MAAIDRRTTLRTIAAMTAGAVAAPPVMARRCRVFVQRIGKPIVRGCAPDGILAFGH